jgi:hypothetical protein
MDYLPEPAIPVVHARTYGGNAAFHNFHNDFSHISDPNLRRRLALAEVDKASAISVDDIDIPANWVRFPSDGTICGRLQLLG